MLFRMKEKKKIEELLSIFFIFNYIYIYIIYFLSYIIYYIFFFNYEFIVILINIPIQI